MTDEQYDELLEFPKGLYFPVVNPTKWHKTPYSKPFGKKKWTFGKMFYEHIERHVR